MREAAWCRDDPGPPEVQPPFPFGMERHESQIQIANRGVGLRASDRASRGPNNGRRQRHGQVETPRHGRRAEERELNALGVEPGVS